MVTISGNMADGKAMQVGGWYKGQQWNGSSLSAPGVTSSGQTVSNAVVSQTNPANVAYLNQLRGNTNVGVTSSGSSGGGVQGQLDAATAALNASLASQKATTDAALVVARQKETDTLASEKALSTPFRQDYQTQQQDKLDINKNFQANQDLTDELGTLLQQGNDLLKQQESVTGLASVRNPRVQQTLSDITARAGVIQAVMSARNNQITQAQNIIDSNVNAINADRQDQMTYYNTVLQLNRQDILSLDNESKDLASQQIGVLRDQVTSAQATADYIKKLMVDPATAELMGNAGVSLNDSIDQINAKVTQATYAKEVADMSNQVTASGAQAVLSPKGIPANQLVTLTDSKGISHYYQKPASAGGGGGGKAATTSDYIGALKQDASSGMTLSQIYAIYSGYLNPDQIYQLYNSSHQEYGKGPITPDKGSVANLAKYGVKQPKA